MLAHITSGAVALLFVTFSAPFAAASIIGDTFAIGDPVAGSFAYDLGELIPTDVPDPGDPDLHVFNGPNSFMSISVGAAEFSSSPTADLTLWVGDTDQPSNTDFILFLSSGREDTFAYLTGFARQDPETRPIGQLFLNLRFPHSYLSDVGLPSTIDPAATTATSSLPPISGELDGISMRSNGNYREWALFFLVNPEDMAVSVSGDIVRGNFTGVISGIEDRALYVPEPACGIIVAIVLCHAAFSQALKSRGRSRKREPSAPA